MQWDWRKDDKRAVGRSGRVEEREEGEMSLGTEIQNHHHFRVEIWEKSKIYSRIHKGMRRVCLSSSALTVRKQYHPLQTYRVSNSSYSKNAQDLEEEDKKPLIQVLKRQESVDLYYAHGQGLINTYELVWSSQISKYSKSFRWKDSDALLAQCRNTLF